MGPRILVVGGGAIGGVTAAALTTAGHPVTVIDASPDHVVRLRSPGLTIINGRTEQVIPLDAVTDASELDGTFDFALIAVKALQHRAALEPLVAAGVVDTFVSLGNGLIHDRLAGMLPAGALMVCLVEWGATNIASGRVARDTFAPMVVGELDGSVRPRARTLAQALEAVGDASTTENIRGKIWAKLLTNTTFTGLSALSGLRWGAVSEHPDGRRAALAIWREGVEVGQAADVKIEPVMGVEAEELVNPSRAPETLARMMATVGNTKPSMLQDLEAGRLTEVDVINGGVGRVGAEHNIETPWNDRVVEAVHAIERGERRPDPAELDALVRQAA